MENYYHKKVIQNIDYNKIYSSKKLTSRNNSKKVNKNKNPFIYIFPNKNSTKNNAKNQSINYNYNYDFINP